jgi:hypothetical protein
MAIIGQQDTDTWFDSLFKYAKEAGLHPIDGRR